MDIIKILNNPNYKFPDWWTDDDYFLAKLIISACSPYIANNIHTTAIKNIKTIWSFPILNKVFNNVKISRLLFSYSLDRLKMKTIFIDCKFINSRIHIMNSDFYSCEFSDCKFVEFLDVNVFDTCFSNNRVYYYNNENKQPVYTISDVLLNKLGSNHIEISPLDFYDLPENENSYKMIKSHEEIKG